MRIELLTTLMDPRGALFAAHSLSPKAQNCLINEAGRPNAHLNPLKFTAVTWPSLALRLLELPPVTVESRQQHAFVSTALRIFDPRLERSTEAFFARAFMNII